MHIKCNFPADQQRYGERRQYKGVILPDKKQRGEHHGIVPIVNAAVCAASALQKPALKRAEKEDTDQIADGVSTAKDDHHAIVQQSLPVKKAKECVAPYPDHCDQNSCMIVLNLDFRLSGFFVVSGKLFLRTGALKGIW